jgi:hypothetical protein
MVALAGNNDGELRDLLAAQLLETFLHVVDFLLKNGCVLSCDNVSMVVRYWGMWANLQKRRPSNTVYAEEPCLGRSSVSSSWPCFQSADRCWR